MAVLGRLVIKWYHRSCIELLFRLQCVRAHNSRVFGGPILLLRPLSVCGGARHDAVSNISAGAASPRAPAVHAAILFDLSSSLHLAGSSGLDSSPRRVVPRHRLRAGHAPRAPAASAAKLLTLATAHGPEEKRVSPLAELTPYARRSPDDATVLPAFCLLNVRTHGHCTRPRIPIAIGHQSHQHPITAHRPWSAHTRPRAHARRSGSRVTRLPSALHPNTCACVHATSVPSDAATGAHAGALHLPRSPAHAMCPPAWLGPVAHG